MADARAVRPYSLSPPESCHALLLCGFALHFPQGKASAFACKTEGLMCDVRFLACSDALNILNATQKLVKLA